MTRALSRGENNVLGGTNGKDPKFVKLQKKFVGWQRNKTSSYQETTTIPIFYENKRQKGSAQIQCLT